MSRPLAHPGNFQDHVVRQFALDADAKLIVRSRPPVVIEKRDVGGRGRIDAGLRGDGQGLLNGRKWSRVAIHANAERGGRSCAGSSVTGPVDASAVAPDGLAEAVSQEGHKN